MRHRRGRHMTAKSSQSPPDSPRERQPPSSSTEPATITTVAYGRTSERTTDQAETALAHDGDLGGRIPDPVWRIDGPGPTGRTTAGAVHRLQDPGHRQECGRA